MLALNLYFPTSSFLEVITVISVLTSLIQIKVIINLEIVVTLVKHLV